MLRLLDSEAVRTILGALAMDRLRPSELEDRMIARSSLFRHLRELEAVEAIVKRRIPGPPHSTEYELSVVGKDLRDLLARVESWLQRRPGPALTPEASWKAVAALSEGWASEVMQSVVLRPLSRNDLAEIFLPEMTLDELKGRIDRLLSAKLVERIGATGSARRYALTEWGRRGIGMLAAAATWETVHLPGRSIPITAEHGVATLCATLPLAEHPARVTGLCDFTVRNEPGDRNGGSAVRAWVEVRDGQVIACGTGRPRNPTSAWAHGSTGDWLSALLMPRVGALQVGGNAWLAKGLLEQLHAQLYGYL